ncbi:MAG: substrate-binding domain-containing protein [Anaerolineales bacterium]|nr:substrate-binding domain-containing protein [Anaerolineales bacterium]
MKTENGLKLIFALLMGLALLLSACGGAAEPQGGEEGGTIAISGAFALYPMMQRWAEEYQKINPAVQFDISAGGAGKGMTDALSGAVEIGMVSRAITPEEEAQGAFWVPVVKDAVFPMVNEANPVLQDLLTKGVTKATFEKIYITGEITTWGEVVGRPEVTEAINVYTRSDAAGAPEVWAKYLGKKQEDLIGVGVFGDPGLLEAVVKDPMGIGYNNLGYAFDNASGKPVAGSVVVPIDVNENGVADPDEVLQIKSAAVEAVASGKYPSPPARPLNLVTKGQPTPLVKAFIEWILTDGQQYVGEAGYVQLAQDQLDEAFQKLK